MRRFFRSDRAATDPILVIAAIAVSLVLLVGGSFGVSAMIASAKNTNTQKDLAAVAAAQNSAAADGRAYFTYDSVTDRALQRATIGFTPSAGTYITTVACNGGWVAAARASTGKVYVSSSEHPQPSIDTGIPVSDCFTSQEAPSLAATAAAATGSTDTGPTTTNLITCGSFENLGSTADCGINGFYEGYATVDDTRAKFGKKSLRIEQKTDRTNGITWDKAFWSTTSPEYGTYQQGDTVAVGAWVWVPKGIVIGFGARSDKALGGAGYGARFTGTGGWQWISYTYVILPSVADKYYDPVITMGTGTDAAPIGTTMWMDGVTMVHSRAPLPATPAFQDGDSDGWTWNGAAGSSASTGPMRSY